jgi:peptidyl-prolyl cis-trans isomerase D
MPTARWFIWVRNAALLLVIVTFIAFFGLPSGEGGGGAVAEVDGEAIGRDAYEFFREQTASRVEATLGSGADAALVRDIVDSQTREAVIHRYVLGREARALGFEVSDAELRDHLRNDQTFSPGKRFDKESFERFAARNFGTPRDYLEELRRDLLLTKLHRLLQSPVRVAPADVREAVERDLLELRLRYAEVRAADARASLAVTPEEVRAFAEAQRARVQEVYDRRRSEFEQEEQVRARHLLFKGDGARERAEQALLRLRAGEDFAKVARESSDDPATREEGGDLGYFPRGRMLPAFEAAAFALEPGKVSDPVETDQGIHLIEVTERRAATARPFEQVMETLAEGLLRDDRAREQARKQAHTLGTRVRAGEDFAFAAASVGARVQETPLFRSTERTVPGIGRLPGLLEEALSLTPEKPASPTVFESGDAYYLIALLERKEPDPAAVEAQLSATRERLEVEARSRLQSRFYRERRAELDRAGKIRLYDLAPGG